MDIVRTFEPGDHEELTELFVSVLSDFTDLLAPSGCGPDAFLNDPASFVFGAYVDDVPAGLAYGIEMRYPNGRLVTYLHELDVRSEFRRRGLATALIEQSMARARDRGSTRFWLSTGGHNAIAQSLYESLGGDRKPLGDVNYWWDLA